MSNSIFSASDVLEKFQRTLSEDDHDAWSKLPISEDEKRDLLMENSKDPEVQRLYAHIKKLRKLALEESSFTESEPRADDEHSSPADPSTDPTKTAPS